jgi:hypothetical protein
MLKVFLAHAGNEMESLEKEGVKRLFIVKLNMKKQLDSGATSRCIIELYEK